MAKVLRLHSGAQNTSTHWDTTNKIGQAAIDTIQDEMVATAKMNITSIPSPFARMDLAKRAFAHVADRLHKKEAPEEVYMKIVSDCLDVAQIFFNIERFSDCIEIIEWNKANCLNELAIGGSSEHKRLADTLNLYFTQDAAEYNFGQLNSIYLLNFTRGNYPLNIIGATSPATLFFTSANDYSQELGNYITFGLDKPFDNHYTHLYKRDKDFILYMYRLRQSINNFAVLFPEVFQYMQACYVAMPNDDFKTNVLNRINSEDYANNYDAIPVGENAMAPVNIFGHPLRRRGAVQIRSDFEIATTKNVARRPLVLPTDLYTSSSMYVSAPWDPNTDVPYIDNRPLEQRTLPADGTKYPYLTIGDFLEDYIVKVAYDVNADAFFDGNPKESNAGFSYVLPIKREYFNYFTAKDLQSTVCGLKAVEMETIAGGAVKVTLRIPIKANQNNGFIQYQRVYYKDSQADATQNKGGVIVAKDGATTGREFTIAMYPHYKYHQNIHNKTYRVMLLDSETVMSANTTYRLSFISEANQPIASNVAYRNRNTDGNGRLSQPLIDTAIYAFNDNFDYIAIDDSNDPKVRGVIIPKISTANGGRKFRFAIDFGTTNTHIEYAEGTNAPQSFNITRQDVQVQKLHKCNDVQIDLVVNSNLIPELVGADSNYRYPMRTALSVGQSVDWNVGIVPMAHTNIPFTYEKNTTLAYDNIFTNLKWSNDANANKIVEQYVEALLMMIRNKVIINNGSVDATTIVWTYPTSMTQYRYNQFKTVWENKFAELFGDGKLDSIQGRIVAVPESLAPYIYYRNNMGAFATTVSVDIGGGTTDVLVSTNGTPQLLTSFRFAANTVFGDGYNYNANTNGVVNKYVPEVIKTLEANGLSSLIGVLGEIQKKADSNDIMAFLFSLEGNKDVLSKSINISLNNMLDGDGRGKYAVLVFYSAIIYHIAKLMKAKNYPMPRNITFSGNGSKVIRILTSSDETLKDYTELIIKRVYGCEQYSDDGLTILRPQDAKASTCKGALDAKAGMSYAAVQQMQEILLGVDDTTFATQNMTYEDISDEVKANVKNSVKEFVDFVFKLHDEYLFDNNFNIDLSVMKRVHELCGRDVDSYLSAGLQKKQVELDANGQNNRLEEPLFFYPLVGIINAIVREVYKLN